MPAETTYTCDRCGADTDRSRHVTWWNGRGLPEYFCELCHNQLGDLVEAWAAGHTDDAATFIMGRQEALRQASDAIVSLLADVPVEALALPVGEDDA